MAKEFIKKKTMVRYTTLPAFEYATKHLETMSFKNPKDTCLKAMNGKRIKIVVKIFELEGEEEEATVEKSKKSKKDKNKKKRRNLL